MQTQAFWNDSVRRRRDWYGLRVVMKQIADVFGAIGEAVRLSRQYDELTSRGMSPQDAARKVFEPIGKLRR